MYQRFSRASTKLGLGHIGGIVRAGDHWREVEHDADRRLRGDLTDLAHGEGMADQQMVSGRHAGGAVLAPGGVFARHVAVVRRDERLIDRHPRRDPVAEPFDDDPGVLGERLGGRPHRPAATVLERLGKIPVVQRRQRRDSRLRGARRRGGRRSRGHDGSPSPTPVGSDTRPGDREAVGVEADLAHHLDVVAPTVVVVARHRTARAVGDLARRGAEAVPDALAAPVGGRPRPRSGTTTWPPPTGTTPGTDRLAAVLEALAYSACMVIRRTPPRVPVMQKSPVRARPSTGSLTLLAAMSSLEALPIQGDSALTGGSCTGDEGVHIPCPRVGGTTSVRR